MASVGLRLLPKEEETVAPVTRGLTPTRQDSWPDAVAYREAVQHPQTAFTDPRFQNATLALDRRNLPLTYTGRFAAVFRAVLEDGTAWAVRCYTNPHPLGQEYVAQRYRLMAGALQRAGVAGLFAPFHYLAEGIQVGGKRYPVLAMPWVTGEPLGRFVEKHHADPTALLTLARTLGEALARLTAAGIAHGDWQHDNILVSEGGRRVVFVDYDGVYTPDLEMAPATERGHPNYQHPKRGDRDYGPDIDRFPCLVLQTALTALAVEPSLWDSFSDGESIVFRRADFEDPEASTVFATVRLVSHSAPELGGLLKTLEESCHGGTAVEPVDAKIIEKVARRLGVTVGTPLLEPVATPALPGRRSAVVPLLEHEVEETEEEKEAKRRSFLETVAMSSEAVRWFNKIRTGLQKQQTQELVHLWAVRAFFLLLVLYVYLWPFHEPDGVFRFFGSLFLGPAGLATGYFLWPRNLEGIAIDDAMERNTAQMEINTAQFQDVSHRLGAINRNPSNLSAVAFVASALQGITLESHRERLGLTAPELERLRLAGITRLSDLPADLPHYTSHEARNALYALKQETMDAARLAYDDLSRERRELQHERDRLEAERQGLNDTDFELRRRLVVLGSGSFGRFLVRVLGG